MLGALDHHDQSQESSGGGRRKPGNGSGPPSLPDSIPGLLLVFETVPSSLSREGGRCMDPQVPGGRFRRDDGPGLPILVSALHPLCGSGCFRSGQLLGLTVASSSSSTSKEISELQAGSRIALTFNLLVILRLFDLSSSFRPEL